MGSRKFSCRVIVWVPFFDSGTLHMAIATILHVGEDFCRRIPVLEKAGFTVLESEGSIAAVERAFSGGDIFSAVTFHSDLAVLPSEMVRTTRTLSIAPCVLFADPALQLDESDFDLIVPALTPPSLLAEADAAGD